MKQKIIAVILALGVSALATLQASDISANDIISKITQSSGNSKLTTETIAQYFREGEEGWFWYKELPEEVKEELLEVIQKASQAAQPQEKKEKPLSPAWFRENFQIYLDAAIDNPEDTEAMRTYLYLEKYQQDRSELFAYKRNSAYYSDPYLDEGKVFSTSQFGSSNIGVESEKIRKQMLKDLTQNFGLYFFFRSDCNFCHQQFPVVDYLRKVYGYEIKAVSLDGSGLAGTRFESEYLVDSGQAASLGIGVVPGLVLFDAKDKSAEVITQGLQSVSEVERRLLYAAERKGYISESEFNQIKGKGVYQSLDGSIVNQFPYPENAPDEFKRLMKEAMGE